MRIDSHQHFWKTSRCDYHWMTPSAPVLYRDYLPDDLRPLLQKAGMDKSVVVQAAQTAAETDFLLDLAASCDFIAGVVGWIDMESPNFPDVFERYRANPKFIGLRPMLQDLPDDEWILRPSVLASLKVIAQADFPFDFLTYTRHLPHVWKVLQLVPGLRAVIDHISKPEIRAHRMEPWRTLLAEVAQHKKVYCKLSGMVTEADHTNWTLEDLRPYVDHVLDQFGWDRVMFGSDWPVCRLAAEYEDVVGTIESLVPAGLDAESKGKLFGGNAATFYRLADRA